MTLPELPAEIWTHIFDLAADEDVIYQYGLPTAMAESAWYKTVFGSWILRSPQEALNLIQRRSYVTKKAIISTCKLWHSLGSQFLFRCLLLDHPTELERLCGLLNRSSALDSTSLGWWTKRIHLTRYYPAGRRVDKPDMASELVSVIRHCQNLEIFIIDGPLGDAFGPVADTLATYTFSTLRTVHWNVPAEEIPKVIWALASLPHLLAAHIEFELPTTGEIENIPLGAASDVHLTLPCLQQLSLRGYFQTLLEEAAGWSIPALRIVSLDCGNSITDLPDVISFLQHHGASLLFFDIYSIPPLDVATILDLCPRLTTFNFNADWRLPFPGEADAPAALTAPPTPGLAPATLVHAPHDHITTIGLHSLFFAFGVGYSAEYASVEPLRPYVVRRTNDRNVAALTLTNFPNLRTVRVLSPTVLSDLNKADGPREEGGGMARWELWWNTFTKMGVRLEDCTGAPLGTLPVDEDDTDDEDDEEDSEDEYETEESPGPNDRVSELRLLLEECRKMDETREEFIYVNLPSGSGDLA